ncbi:hypothetical protein M422DRAFT_173499, partial [Sphaerobolus stellatus SS14]
YPQQDRVSQDYPDLPVKVINLLALSVSCSLLELTRQITPPTKNGHAPPPIKSRKSYQSVNPSYVWTW